MKRFLAITASLICCMGNEMPAKADFTSDSNAVCEAIVNLNQVSGASAAPGTPLGNIVAGKIRGEFSYSTLWELAKASGNSDDCKRMY